MPLDSVTFNGAAANAQRMADRVDIVTSGQGKEIVKQATHPSDPIGTVIGGNEPQSGLSVSPFNAHASYTKDLPPENSESDLKDLTDQAWGEGKINAPVKVLPNRLKADK